MNCGPLLLIPAGGSGNFDLSGQEDLSPPSRCPGLHPDAEPGTGMLNRARPSGNSPGNNSTAWDSHAGLPTPQVSWFHAPAPPGRGVIRPSTPHPKTRSRAPLGWNNPPTPPRWNASESSIIARRCPQDISSKGGGYTPAAELALNRLRVIHHGFSNSRLSLRQSRPRNWRPGNPHHASNSPGSSPESFSGKAQRNFPVEDRKWRSTISGVQA